MQNLLTDLSDQLTNTSKSKETPTQQLTERENFLDYKTRYAIPEGF